MENLKELGIGGTQIPGLGSLANLKNLKSLRIVDQASTELSPFGTLTNLEYLWIRGPTQLNALPLHNLGRLRKLSLVGMGFGRLTAVTDIDALRDLKELRKLTLGSLQIGDLAFVTSLKNLNEINIGDRPISSVEPFSV